MIRWLTNNRLFNNSNSDSKIQCRCQLVAIMKNITILKINNRFRMSKLKGRIWELRTFRMWRRLRCSTRARTKGSPTIRWATSSPWMALRDRSTLPSRTLETSSPTRWRGSATEWTFISSKSRGTGSKWSSTTTKPWSPRRPVWRSASPKDSGDRSLGHSSKTTTRTRLPTTSRWTTSTTRGRATTTSSSARRISSCTKIGQKSTKPLASIRSSKAWAPLEEGLMERDTLITRTLPTSRSVSILRVPRQPIPLCSIVSNDVNISETSKCLLKD